MKLFSGMSPRVVAIRYLNGVGTVVPDNCLSIAVNDWLHTASLSGILLSIVSNIVLSIMLEGIAASAGYLGKIHDRNVLVGSF